MEVGVRGALGPVGALVGLSLTGAPVLFSRRQSGPVNRPPCAGLE